MESGTGQIRNTRPGIREPAFRSIAAASRVGPVLRAQTMADAGIQPEARSGRLAAVQARPLVELLACPPETGKLLNAAALSLSVDTGQVVFRQGHACKGLYLLVSGHFLRRTERLDTRLILGSAHAGDLVELAATLGDGRHTYTLTAQTPGSVLLLPMAALTLALESYPPMRMRLLEELAREVSRSYEASCQNRAPKTRRRSPEAPVD